MITVSVHVPESFQHFAVSLRDFGSLNPSREDWSRNEPLGEEAPPLEKRETVGKSQVGIFLRISGDFRVWVREMGRK